jgi:hypothetical protein
MANMEKVEHKLQVVLVDIPSMQELVGQVLSIKVV